MGACKGIGVRKSDVTIWGDMPLGSTIFFFFKQKTAYEVLTCDWSSDVCSSDLIMLINCWYSVIFHHKQLQLLPNQNMYLVLSDK